MNCQNLISSREGHHKIFCYIVFIFKYNFLCLAIFKVDNWMFLGYSESYCRFFIHVLNNYEINLRCHKVFRFSFYNDIFTIIKMFKLFLNFSGLTYICLSISEFVFLKYLNIFSIVQEKFEYVSLVLLKKSGLRASNFQKVTVNKICWEKLSF